MCNLSKNSIPPLDVNVLVVDGDAIALNTTMEILASLNYKVVGTGHSSLALNNLRNHQGYFHLIVMEVHMPDLDGFKLKQIIDEEFAIPVIMISADNREETQIKALMSGVMRYILKPAKAEDFIGIWQFAVAVMLSSGESKHHKELSCSSFTQEDSLTEEKSDDMEHSSINTEKDNGSPTQKSTKFIWTKDHQSQFLEAIDVLGPKNAIPKNILEVMNVEGLTRRNVASHLQKYRLYLRRVERIFAAVIKKANEDNDAFLSKMASTQSSLVLKLIEEDLEKNLKHSKRRSLVYLETDDIYISHLRSKLSSLLSKYDIYSYIKLNPFVKRNLPSSKINNLATKPYHPYLNANDALSASNLVQYNEPSQNPPTSPPEIVNYSTNKLRMGQALSSNVAKYNDVGLLKPSFANLVRGERSSEVYSKNQTLPISMAGTNTAEDIAIGGNLFQPQQHQIYNQEYHRTLAMVDNNFASQGTSNRSHFKEIDYAFSMEDFLNEVPLQDKNKGNCSGKETIPSNCTMDTNTTKFNTSMQERDHATIESILDDFP